VSSARTRPDGIRSGAARAFALGPREEARLAARARAAVATARRAGEAVLATLSLPLSPDADPTAIACASRAPGEPWFTFEQPDRGVALAGLGEATRVEASGAERFAVAGARWRALSATAVGDRLVAVGGFAFAPEGGGSPRWSGFEPASLVVPEVLIERSEGERSANLVLAALVGPHDSAEEIVARLRTRAAGLHAAPLPLIDPHPAGVYRVASAMPPEHFEAAVARAVELIGAREIQKIVLAREVHALAPRAYDPAAIVGVLREEFPSCYVFCVGRGEATFLAASPELLVRREGQRVSTIALAGSTRRSADPAIDAHLGEQLLRDPVYREEHAIVARRIERSLRAHAVWVAAAKEPTLVKIANIQHLATPIRAQMSRPLDALELLAAMHPTPAVGGEPLSRAAPLIPALEGLDRGWYAGPVGWTDAAGDGEFCVALRSALLRGEHASAFAGNGIVADSDPSAELAETEVKLAALLPLLAG
jgi:salicylate biosynthesis isochorismate synthase